MAQNGAERRPFWNVRDRLYTLGQEPPSGDLPGTRRTLGIHAEILKGTPTDNLEKLGLSVPERLSNFLETFKETP